jgi:hypothetical protein
LQGLLSHELGTLPYAGYLWEGLVGVVL